MHLLYNGLHIGRSRSSKVVDFGTNRKGICNFLLVINSNFGPIYHVKFCGCSVSRPEVNLAHLVCFWSESSMLSFSLSCCLINLVAIE